MAQKLLHRLAENPVVGRAAALVEALDSASPRVLRVLTYHRVDEGAPFAAQMRHLGERYQVVSLPRVLVALDGGPPLPARAVLLTFDDAYRSFAEVAWPILAQAGFTATLFVPSAYPDGDLARFWWDRLEQAFARTTRREPLATPLGLLALASPAERAAAHRLVKAHVKDLAHADTLAESERLCAALGVPGDAHEVLGWAELRALAAQGVTLGAHTRTHPRLDRVPRAEARNEVLGSLADLAREVPGAPRVFAYPDGRFDDELVELLRAAGTELAFTTRRGTNDLASADRLRLRRLNVDARDSLAVFRAKLALSAARLRPLVRALDRPSPAERRAERAQRSEHRRSQLVLRSLDAVLTARVRPEARALSSLRTVLAPHSSRYDRLGHAARLAARSLPGFGARLERALLDQSRLPFPGGACELVAFGSGATVFRLRAPGQAPRALKIYRRTLGRETRHLVAAAGRYRERYARLRAAFGAVVLPAEFVVLHGPLRGAPAVACLQPWVAGRPRDLLALGPGELLEFARARPSLAEALQGFARRALEWRERAFFPDLLGSGNLVAAEEPGPARLWLLDYGIFDPSENPPASATRAALDSALDRLARFLEGMERDVVVHA